MLPAVPALALLLMQTNTAAMPHLKACSEALARNAAADAIKSCKTAVGLDPRSAAAHMLLGQAYLATRNTSMAAEAKAEFQQALDIDPALIWGRFYLAKVYIDMGRFDRAKEELEQALETRPGVPHMLSLLGEAERKLNHPEEAIALQRKALAADPGLSAAHYYEALAWIDLKKDDEAIIALEASVKSPYVAPEFYLTLGSLYAQRRRYQEAEDLCRKAIALDPSRSESYLNMAQLMNARSLSDRAIEALHQALPPGKTFATSPYYQKLQADIHFEFGRAYAAKGKPRDAIASYEQCLALDNSRAAAHRALAGLYQAQGNPARAAEHTQAAAVVEARK